MNIFTRQSAQNYKIAISSKKLMKWRFQTFYKFGGVITTNKHKR